VPGRIAARKLRLPSGMSPLFVSFLIQYERFPADLRDVYCPSALIDTMLRVGDSHDSTEIDVDVGSHDAIRSSLICQPRCSDLEWLRSYLDLYAIEMVKWGIGCK
jgi:hypothetical protein